MFATAAKTSERSLVVATRSSKRAATSSARAGPSTRHVFDLNLSTWRERHAKLVAQSSTGSSVQTETAQTPASTPTNSQIKNGIAKLKEDRALSLSTLAKVQNENRLPTYAEFAFLNDVGRRILAVPSFLRFLVRGGAASLSSADQDLLPSIRDAVSLHKRRQDRQTSYFVAADTWARLDNIIQEENILSKASLQYSDAYTTAFCRAFGLDYSESALRSLGKYKRLRRFILSNSRLRYILIEDHVKYLAESDKLLLRDSAYTRLSTEELVDALESRGFVIDGLSPGEMVRKLGDWLTVVEDAADEGRIPTLAAAEDDPEIFVRLEYVVDNVVNSRQAFRRTASQTFDYVVQ